MPEKDFFIVSIPMIEMQGSTHIPTVVYYEKSKRTLIGYEARAASEATGHDTLNKDFKIDIGKDDPSLGRSKRRFRTATGDEKSAGEITGDFIDGVLRYARDALPIENINEQEGIVIAEPLTMQGEEVKDDWLGNYRSTIRRVLLGKKFSKDNIDFMPEPFAVFQYYKYGLKHPLLGSTKQVALVLDFGGGSFDVCIIETDKEGEVSGKRKNTRPLAASSAPVGGYYVNRVLAEALFLRAARHDKEQTARIKRGLRVYSQWRDEGEKGFELSNVKSDLQNFAHKFYDTIYNIEEPKLTLCNAITDWDLQASLSPALSVPVKLPRDPFSRSPYFNAQLTAADFRDVFVEKVWEERLQPIIRSALERGRDELKGAPITVVLLSGGSCNIRWIEKLLERDFATELEEAQILQLEGDFQEVVAKGVAIECARRFFDQEEHAGDFSSVTYNRLHLVLDSDQKGLQLKTFAPTDGNPIPSTGKHGVLLPSASVLRNQFDKPLNWRVRLDRPPHQFLDYYFLRTGFTPQIQEGLVEGESSKYSDDLLNLNHRVKTPRACPFDSDGIHVELKIEKETKTARVRFIYAKETHRRKDYSVDGVPFFLDMTDTQDNPTTKAYVGLDFGTSNTSVSYVSQAAVQIFKKRSAERYWQELDSAHKVLPYPLAIPLSRYLSDVDASKMISHAREFTEAALALAAYISYLEFCLYKGRRQSHILKGFTQRSVGPLWRLLQDSLHGLGDSARISAPYGELLSPNFFKQVNEAVSFFAQHKHDKVESDAFNENVIQIISNISQRVFSTYKFGYFENVQQEAFKLGTYRGRFRHACGSNVHFDEADEYVGGISFPNNLAFLVNFEQRRALPLYPLVFWFRCDIHVDEDHCFVFDKALNQSGTRAASFKASGFPCNITVSPSHSDLAPVLNDLYDFLEVDRDVSVFRF